MDIGTAKPSPKEQKEVPYWGLDLLEPGEYFNAYKFKKYAERAMRDIKSRGNLPLLVGGTGLYIDSLIYNFGFVTPTNIKEREKFEKLTTEQLQQIIKQKGYEVPYNSQNRRHLIRSIERRGITGTRAPIRADVLLIGLN